MSTATRSGGTGSTGGTGRIVAIVAALAIIAFLAAWLGGWIRFTTDPRVTAIQQLQEETRQKFVASGGPQTLTEAKEAVAAMGQIREQIRSLPEHLQPQAEAAGSSMFRTAMRQRIDAYFAAPPEKRVAELDRQIKQEELMRQAFEASGGAGGAARAGGDAARERAAAAPQSGGGGRSRTEEDRNRWRKNMIDRTSPQMRARYVEYRAAMEKRRQELGMPSGGFGPR